MVEFILHLADDKGTIPWFLAFSLVEFHGISLDEFCQEWDGPSNEWRPDAGELLVWLGY